MLQLSMDDAESWRVSKSHWNKHETRPKGLLDPTEQMLKWFVSVSRDDLNKKNKEKNNFAMMSWDMLQFN